MYEYFKKFTKKSKSLEISSGEILEKSLGLSRPMLDLLLNVYLLQNFGHYTLTDIIFYAI